MRSIAYFVVSLMVFAVFLLLVFGGIYYVKRISKPEVYVPGDNNPYVENNYESKPFDYDESKMNPSAKM